MVDHSICGQGFPEKRLDRLGDRKISLDDLCPMDSLQFEGVRFTCVVMDDDPIAFLEKAMGHDAPEASGSPGYQDNFAHRMQIITGLLSIDN